jgi:hypothetical protein
VLATETVAVAATSGLSDASRPVELVRRLCRALADAGIDYCHWKSNNALDRSARGANDLDLLVNRADETRFVGIMSACGFKLAHAPADKQMTGVVDYFGYDPPADRWIHVHAHYQLVAGHDLTKDYRIPIERAYLESCTQGPLFRVPAVELEFIVFVIRMILKHSTWDAVLGREGRLSKNERGELRDLQSRVSRERVTTALETHLPCVSPALLGRCIEALGENSSIRIRMTTGLTLQRALAANAGHSAWIDAATKAVRRVVKGVRRRVMASEGRYRLATGGATIALVGGDGAGKSTAAEGLHAWLSTHFDASRVHLGRPAWSVSTIALRTALKAGQIAGLYPLETSVRETVQQVSPVSPGYPWLIREVCRARDRYRRYVTARRRAARGSLVLFDRFPVPEIQGMDGPLTRQFIRRLLDARGARGRFHPRPDAPLAQCLVHLEERTYRRMLPPDIIAVLRVDPETAVRRKPDEDPAAVRERSAEVWNVRWQRSRACIIDASQSPGAVLSELKALIWSQL